MIFSIGFSIKSIESSKVWQRIFYFLFSSIFAIITFLLMEYYIGMEGYRFLFLGYILWKLKDDKIINKLKRVVLNFIPFAIPPLLFLSWRIFIFEGNRPTTNIDRIFLNFSNSPILSAVNI